MKIDKQTRIGVLMGGLSSEREVSLETGAGVHSALVELGYDAVAIDWNSGTSLTRLLADEHVDVVWNALHGTCGEDGAVQGLLTCLAIAYTGSDILASALAMDKVASKRMFEARDVPTPTWTVAADAVTAADLGEWPHPMVIKPAGEGSSVGVSVVFEAAALPDAIARARGLHGPILVERYIAGAEIHTGVLDGQVIGSVEVVPASGFYDYEAKYKRDDTEYHCPPRLDADILDHAEVVALHAHDALGCGSYSRVDLRIDDCGAPFVLEVNTLPGMTTHSLMPKIAAEYGISYAALCERILLLAR